MKTKHLSRLAERTANSHPKILVLGYGNLLRGDDGVGYRVAEAVDSWNLENVRSLSLHQLTPELAEEISCVKSVIFVDAIAYLSPKLPAPTISSIQAKIDSSFTGHHVAPAVLLALAKMLYGADPRAFQLLIPVSEFPFDDQLSDAAQTNLAIALERINTLIAMLLTEFSEY